MPTKEYLNLHLQTCLKKMLYGKWNKELKGGTGNFEKGFEAAKGFKNRIEAPRSKLRGISVCKVKCIVFAR